MTPNITLPLDIGLPSLLLICFFMILGSLLGSFSNVVILRMAEERSVVFPPSSCPHCKHRLSPLDLIPIFGWILLLGKCRYCRAPISVQYPLVETAAALLVGSAFIYHGLSAPRFVASASWSLIWLIVSVLHFRHEVNKPKPYLWPIMYRLLLSFLAGSCNPIGWTVACIGGGAGALIVHWRNSESEPLIWFGTIFVNLVSTWKLGIVYVTSLAVILGYLACRGTKATNMVINAVFFWNLVGLAICAWTGDFGW